MKFFILYFSEITLFTMFFATVTLAAYIYFAFYRPARTMFKLRGFFRLRDSFIYEAAANPGLKKNKFYNSYLVAINDVIKNAERLNIHYIYDALKRYSQEVEKGNIQTPEEIHPEIMKKLVSNFSGEFIFFAFSNSSIFMRCTVRILTMFSSSKTVFVTAWLKLLGIFSLISAKKEEEYEIYKQAYSSASF